MARMLGMSMPLRDFWVVGAKGLITKERENIEPDVMPFARKVKEIGSQGLMEGQAMDQSNKSINEQYEEAIKRQEAVAKALEKRLEAQNKYLNMKDRTTGKSLEEERVEGVTDFTVDMITTPHGINSAAGRSFSRK